jgi:hypothetical protein
MGDPTSDLLTIAGRFPSVQPTATATPDPYAAAIQQAKQKYPRIASIPFKLTTGKGPGMSETYEPDDEDNPHKGNWTVQLRHPSVINNPSSWPDYVALESLHPLYAHDQGYRQLTNQFVKSMTPDQLADARRGFAKDQQMFPEDRGKTTFDDWLARVQAQEYIRGMIFPKANPGWLGPQGEGRYTPQQLQLGQQIQKYLQTQ